MGRSVVATQGLKPNVQEMNLCSSSINPESKVVDCSKAGRDNREHLIYPSLKRPKRRGDLTDQFWEPSLENAVLLSNS